MRVQKTALPPPKTAYELEDGAMRITEVKAPSGYKVVDGKNKGFFYIGSKKVTGQASITVRVTGGKTILAGTEISAEAFKQYEQKERYDFKQGSGCRKRRGTAGCGKGKKCEFHV